MIWLRALLWILWLVACLYQLATRVLVRRFRRFEVDPPVSRRPGEPVSLLKPLYGTQERTENNIRSFAEQDYLGPSEVLLTVGRPGDPALDMARRLAAEDPRYRLLEGDTAGGCVNPKVANLLQGYPHCTAPFILCSDADMHAPPGHLDKMMEPFQDEQVGLVMSLYCAQQAHSPATALEALSGVDFAASVLVARVVEGLSFGLGAHLACRRTALEQIGGFSALGDYLAEDYHIGNRLYRAGWKVKLAGSILEDVLPDLSWKEYLSHQLRWMRTYRISRPGGHLAFITTQGTAWVLALLLLEGWNWPSALALGLWWVIRSRCTAANWRLLGGRSVERWVGWLPLKDLLYLGLWATSLVGDTVRWGPRKLKIFADGRMRPV